MPTIKDRNILKWDEVEPKRVPLFSQKQWNEIKEKVLTQHLLDNSERLGQ